MTPMGRPTTLHGNQNKPIYDSTTPPHSTQAPPAVCGSTQTDLRRRCVVGSMSKPVDRNEVVRPTEAQLRWAQFHSKRRAQNVQQTVDRLWQTPASVSEVEGAYSDDGVTTDTSCNQDRPKISRGRRALLRVSQRSYQLRRLDIQQHGYRGCDPDEDDEYDSEEDELATIFAEEETEWKKKRKRRQHGRLGDGERIRRFEAAFHALMKNIAAASQMEEEKITATKRWTRATPVAVSIDGREYDDLKWGVTHRKPHPNETMDQQQGMTPCDRQASWLVHLPRPERAAKGNDQQYTLEELQATIDVSAGRQKINELVEALHQQTTLSPVRTMRKARLLEGDTSKSSRTAAFLAAAGDEYLHEPDSPRSAVREKLIARYLMHLERRETGDGSFSNAQDRILPVRKGNERLVEAYLTASEQQGSVVEHLQAIQNSDEVSSGEKLIARYLASVKGDSLEEKLFNAFQKSTRPNKDSSCDDRVAQYLAAITERTMEDQQAERNFQNDRGVLPRASMSSEGEESINSDRNGRNSSMGTFATEVSDVWSQARKVRVSSAKNGRYSSLGSAGESDFFSQARRVNVAPDLQELKEEEELDSPLHQEESDTQSQAHLHNHDGSPNDLTTGSVSSKEPVALEKCQSTEEPDATSDSGASMTSLSSLWKKARNITSPAAGLNTIPEANSTDQPTGRDAPANDSKLQTVLGTAKAGSAKVGGFLKRLSGRTSEEDEEELRAVAAFRKSQGERRESVDDSSSTSSFRLLPDGIRRRVVNGLKLNQSFSEEGKMDQETVISHLTNNSREEPPGSPRSEALSTRSSLSAQNVSPEHMKAIHRSVMQNSVLIGDCETEQSIIDTDGNHSDGGSSVVDPAVIASLLLSPTLLTKRHHQAMNAVMRRNWDQVTYLLNANPWLAEMMDMETKQYLLHRLALFGSAAIMVDEDPDSPIAPAPEELNHDLVQLFPASVHKFDKNGNLPLHMAATSGNIHMIQLLGDRFPGGASVMNEEGMLPLHLAILSCAALPPPREEGVNASDLIKTVLNFFPGAVAVDDSQGNLPLHVAASELEGDVGVDVVYALLDEAYRQMQNPAGVRFQNKLKLDEAEEESVSTIETATPTDSSTDVDGIVYCTMVRNNFGETPLIRAIRSGAGWQMIEAIVSGQGGRQAALDIDAEGGNALHLLVSEEYADPAAILSVLKVAPEAASCRNQDGILPIESACINRLPREVILAMALVDLPIDLDAKEDAVVRNGAGGSWWFLACECDDDYIDVVEEVVSLCSYEQLREICLMKGGADNNIPVISQATPKCRHALMKALRFVGRFELLGGAVQANPDMGLQIFDALDFGGDDMEFPEGRRVILQCYDSEESFLNETLILHMYEVDPFYVEDVFKFSTHEYKGRSSKSAPQRFCVATERPSLTLDRVVAGMLKNENYRQNVDMRKRYMVKVCSVLRVVGKSLRHLHRSNMIHGDVCPEVCGKYEDRWKLADVLGLQQIGHVVESSRWSEAAPPEAVEIVHDEEASAGRAVFRSDLRAHPSIDIWAFGRLAFETLVGEPLIEFASEPHEDSAALQQIHDWSEADVIDCREDLEEAGVSPKGIDLILSCLSPQPDERPLNMDEVLEHSFWKEIRRLKPSTDGPEAHVSARR